MSELPPNAWTIFQNAHRLRVRVNGVLVLEVDIREQARIWMELSPAEVRALKIQVELES